MVQKFSHGRGGAGNIKSETVTYVDGLLQSPPVLTASSSGRYTTGRGGAGNMRKYNLEEVRIAQDVPTGPSRIPHATQAGRGGVGNLQAARKREMVRRQSMTIEGRDRTSTDSNNSLSTVNSRASSSSSASDIGVAAWSKNLLFGRRNSTNTKA